MGTVIRKGYMWRNEWSLVTTARCALLAKNHTTCLRGGLLVPHRPQSHQEAPSPHCSVFFSCSCQSTQAADALQLWTCAFAACTHYTPPPGVHAALKKKKKTRFHAVTMFTEDDNVSQCCRSRLLYLWRLVKDRWMAKKKRKSGSCYKQWLHLTTSFFVSHAGLQTGSFRDPSSTLWLQIFIEESSVSEAMLLVCVSLYFWLLLHTPSVSLAQSVRLWVCDRGTLILARWICH